MKRYLLIVVLFINFGCASTITYEPVAHPDQRIVFEGLSFYLPKGENWEMASEPVRRIRALEGFGRITENIKTFKKKIFPHNQLPEKTETIWVEADKLEFALIKFDHADDLRSFVETRYKNTKLMWFILGSNILANQGWFILESNILDKRFKGMNCIKENTKLRTGRKVSGSVVAITSYIQSYTCVHPKNPEQVIELRAIQELPKGQTPTDIQNELDYFFSSLEIHDLP